MNEMKFLTLAPLDTLLLAFSTKLASNSDFILDSRCCSATSVVLLLSSNNSRSTQQSSSCSDVSRNPQTAIANKDLSKLYSL